MYVKHRKWAEAYLKGTFFAGMRTTQKCESLNSYSRHFVEHKLKLYDFIRQIYRAMYCIWHKEVQDEYETNHTAPVLTTHLQSIEKTCVRNIYKECIEMGSDGDPRRSHADYARVRQDN